MSPDSVRYVRNFIASIPGRVHAQKLGVFPPLLCIFLLIQMRIQQSTLHTVYICIIYVVHSPVFKQLVEPAVMLVFSRFPQPIQSVISKDWHWHRNATPNIPVAVISREAPSTEPLLIDETTH
ncbi:hypothetical protein ACRALDRAFT_206733 [Sodiomyces alcalophilus JCM 7366]|uniref:uncharacterized protein n=1 Tax=Sodiomyces alcalophilus JCM 7366 TaxID=591952 RepID=UPI0039B5D5E7